jgi:hypothetical protein
LDRVKEEYEQIVKQEQDEIQIQREEEDEDEERRTMRVVFGRPRMPEPSGLGMGHRHHHHQHHSGSEEDETELVHSSSTSTSTLSPPPPALLLKLSSPTVTGELFERLVSFSTQLESAVELSSSLDARHATAQSTIDALESKVTSLESLIKTSRTAFPFPPPPPSPPSPHPKQQQHPDSLTQTLTHWKKSVEGQWSSVHERLGSALEECESKAGAVDMAVKFDAGLANLAVLQRQQQQHSGGGRLALGMPPNGDVVMW